jgi:hypothetical protein
MNLEDQKLDIISSLAEICRQPRPQPSVRLLELLATFDEVDTASGEADWLRPQLLQWALAGQTHDMVAWTLCRATEDAAKALRVIFRAATRPEALAWTAHTALTRNRHQFNYGWLGQSLFGGVRDKNGFITVGEAYFIAGVAAIEPIAFWKHNYEFFAKDGRGGVFSQHVYQGLTALRTRYAAVLEARGVNALK